MKSEDQNPVIQSESRAFSGKVTPKVSVIVPCRNELAHIGPCLASIWNQAGIEGGFEVIVADGMSDDGTREILKQMQVNGQWSEVGDRGSSSAPSPLRLDRGLEPLGKRRKEFAIGQEPERAERAGANESLGLGEMSLSSSAPNPQPSTINHQPSSSAASSLSASDGDLSRLGSAAYGPVPTDFNSQPSTLNPELGLPLLRVIDNPGRIVSTGLNAAIRAARGEIIIRLDVHTEYAPDYLKECVATLQDTGADNVGGPWVAQGNSYISRTIAAAFQSPFSAGGARTHDANRAGPVDTAYLGCWPKASFERFGLFDEELVRNQDDEHNLRITRGGGKVYQSPKIKSAYRPRASLGALFKQYLQYGYWKVRVIQKHKLPASWRHLVPGAFVLGLSVLLLLSVFCFLLSAFAPHSQSSAFESALSNFCFLLSALCFVSLLSAYTLALMTASLLTAARTEWKLLPALLLVFPCYHFGYGYGFLRGVWDFVIRHKGAHKSFEALTR